jgi:hypothetical protein
MPVFYSCRGRGALPRASGYWREKFHRYTRRASNEDKKEQQEHKKIYGSGPAIAPKPGLRSIRNAVAQCKRGRLPSRPHHRSPSWPKKGASTRKDNCKTKEVHGTGIAAAPKPRLVQNQRSTCLEINYQGPPAEPPPTQAPSSLCLK